MGHGLSELGHLTPNHRQTTDNHSRPLWRHLSTSSTVLQAVHLFGQKISLFGQKIELTRVDQLVNSPRQAGIEVSDYQDTSDLGKQEGVRWVAVVIQER